MLWQLFIGCAVICATLLIQILCITGAIGVLSRIGGSWLASSWWMLRFAVLLTVAVLFVVVGVALCTCVWAMTFMCLDLFHSLESASYFSIVTFTTLGYGDITLGTEWRLLSGLTATNGLIVFGLNTAFLVEVLSRLVRVNEPTRGVD